MLTHSPKIFIGSSTAGYSIAEKLKAHFSKDFDCLLWKESGVWEAGKSTFDNLLRIANYFDFGLFVATSDDLTVTNDRLVLEPRDNVILEMSLFLGALGRHKSFLLVEEGVKLPTDFDGIYMPSFVRKDDDTIKRACGEFINKITEHFHLGHLSLYPTTALALGYYKNFVAGLVESVRSADTLEFGGIPYNNFELNVVLPSNLKGNIRDKAAHFYHRHRLQENSMKTKYRSYPAWFQLDQTAAPNAIMYDMPSTLSAVSDAIQMVFEKGYQGRTKIEEVIEEREIGNFARVLQMQIDENPFATDMVRIIEEF